MKKLLIVGGILVSFSAVSVLANGSFDNGQAQALSANTISNDTTPRKGDTSTRKRDSISFAYNNNVMDTVPKRDSTTRRKTDSISFAYNKSILDTVPKKDTSRRKTDSIAFAIR